jgi:Spy/CpxP family protein refolding chaperone
MGTLGPIMRLDLSDAQRDQLKGMLDAHREETKAVADRVRSSREALQAAVTADSFDEGTIRARSADLASVEADMAVAQARLRTAVLQILTPEQRTQLTAFQAQMKERQERRGPPPR